MINTPWYAKIDAQDLFYFMILPVGGTLIDLAVSMKARLELYIDAHGTLIFDNYNECSPKNHEITHCGEVGYHRSGAFHLPDMQNSRYALKSGWPADRIWFSSWPAENIIYQLAVLENYSWQNVHISGCLAADFSPAGRFEEKYEAGSFR